MSIKTIAFYLPQYHPIPENDEWWGKGFTEWTNVAKAKPLFKGHHQPNLPANLGFYDLRLHEARQAQANLAKKNGLSAFCYWHYWFGNGKKILERPFDEVLSSGKPDFPFCLAWANETWSGIWHGNPNKVLIEQKYPGEKDYENHFYDVLPALSDKRYLRVENKPVFVLYRPYKIPKISQFVDLWQNLAIKNGLDGIHFIGVNWDHNQNPSEINLDAFVFSHENFLRNNKPPGKIKSWYFKMRNRPRFVYDYSDAMDCFFPNEDLPYLYYPCVVPNWDNSPRAGINGTILQNSSPEHFKKVLEKAKSIVEKRENSKKIIFIKSWNEWAEGNYLEPDQRWGSQYLDVFSEVIGD